MAQTPQIQKVELEDEYYHVRFRDPDKFDTIRTPGWAENVGDSVSKSSEVRMGKEQGGDDWLIQSVLIKKEAGEVQAKQQAKKIAEKINE